MNKKTSNKGKSAETNNETSNKKEATMTKEFASMCGDAFDNKKKSSCHQMCKAENPESYQACLENFGAKKKPTKAVKAEAAPIAEKPKKEKTVEAKKEEVAKVEKPKKPAKEFDWFGDGTGTSASMINRLLVNGATLKKISAKCDCNRNRIMGHFTGLRSGKRSRRPMAFELFKSKETNRYHFDHPEVDFEKILGM